MAEWWLGPPAPDQCGQNPFECLMFGTVNVTLNFTVVKELSRVLIMTSVASTSIVYYKNSNLSSN